MTWEELLKQANEVPGDSTVSRKATFEEEHLQQACCKWMAAQYPQWYQLLHHSPNGMRSNAKTGAIFKRMGTKAGFPDLFLYVPQQYKSDGVSTPVAYHGLAIEMKTTNKNSRQSPEQKHWQKILTEQGYRYEVCRTLDEFRDLINEYLNP